MKPFLLVRKIFLLTVFFLFAFHVQAQTTYFLNKSGAFVKTQKDAFVQLEIKPVEENVYSVFVADKTDNKWAKPKFAQMVKKISENVFHCYYDKKMKGSFLIREVIEKTESGYKIRQTDQNGNLQLICDAVELLPLRMNGKCTLYDLDGMSMSEEIYVNGRRIGESLLFHPLDTLRIISKLPEFPGGNMSFRKRIATTVRYPISAIQNRESGKAYAKFLINEKGEMEQIKIANFSSAFSNELHRVLMSIKDLWEPGECDGEKVSVWHYATVKFNCSWQF